MVNEPQDPNDPPVISGGWGVGGGKKGVCLYKHSKSSPVSLGKNKNLTTTHKAYMIWPYPTSSLILSVTRASSTRERHYSCSILQTRKLRPSKCEKLPKTSQRATRRHWDLSDSKRTAPDPIFLQFKRKQASCRT